MKGLLLQSRDKSEGNREAGNSSFYSGNYRQALILYSIAVFTAPQGDGDDCFALALANRDCASIQRRDRPAGWAKQSSEFYCWVSNTLQIQSFTSATSFSNNLFSESECFSYLLPSLRTGYCRF